MSQATPAVDAAATEARGAPATWRHWVVFAALAGGVVILDQLSKAWVTGNLELGESMELLGGWLGFWHVANTGALFGLFRDQAALFALLSIGVIALIVWYHGRAVAGGGWLATIALGLLLGGAIGNFIDRARLGYVVDFVDIGIGDLRWYTFNVADAAISTAIVMLVAAALIPSLAGLGERRPDG